MPSSQGQPDSKATSEPTVPTPLTRSLLPVGVLSGQVSPSHAALPQVVDQPRAAQGRVSFMSTAVP